MEGNVRPHPSRRLDMKVTLDETAGESSSRDHSARGTQIGEIGERRLPTSGRHKITACYLFPNAAQVSRLESATACVRVTVRGGCTSTTPPAGSTPESSHHPEAGMRDI
jgi:hypothetical protein